MSPQPRIAVVGSANVDLTVFTDALPRPGETIFGRRFDLGFGGKGANQAVAARLCGAEVTVVARVGQDLFGPATIRNFQGFGIDTAHVIALEGVTSGVAQQAGGDEAQGDTRMASRGAAPRPRRLREPRTASQLIESVRRTVGGERG